MYSPILCSYSKIQCYKTLQYNFLLDYCSLSQCFNNKLLKFILFILLHQNNALYNYCTYSLTWILVQEHHASKLARNVIIILPLLEIYFY